jgi:hypothetical protein
MLIPPQVPPLIEYLDRVHMLWIYYGPIVDEGGVLWYARTEAKA